MSTFFHPVPLQKDQKTINDVLTIILGDEDDDDRELCISILKDLRIPHHIHEVKNGSELLNLVYNEGQYKDLKIKPDVIVMDLNMPAVNGFEVLQKLKTDQYCKELPIYILSNSYMKQDIELASRLGSSGYFRKTYDHADWKNAMSSICAEVYKKRFITDL